MSHRLQSDEPVRWLIDQSGLGHKFHHKFLEIHPQRLRCHSSPYSPIRLLAAPCRWGASRGVLCAELRPRPLSEPNTSRTATDGSMPGQLVLELQAREREGASLLLRVERVEHWSRSGHGRQSRSSLRQWFDIELKRESAEPVAEPSADTKPDLPELTNLEWSIQGTLLQVRASTLPESLPAPAGSSQVGLELARVLDWFKAGSSL